MRYFGISQTKEKNYSMNYLHSHDFYEFYFQIAGDRRYFIDSEYFELSENTLVAIAPHSLHKFESSQKPSKKNFYERIAVYFTLNKIPSEQLPFLESLTKKRVIQFSEKEMKQIYKTLTKLFTLYNSENVTDKHLQISLFTQLLIFQIYHAQTTQVSSTLSLQGDSLNQDLSHVILKLMDYIQTNYNQPITLKDLCAQSHLSKAWICKAFFQANGMTIFQYKQSLQLNKAKKMLQTTTQPIEKIAKATGFSSANYFTKVFKKRVNSTPSEFRTASRKQR